MSILITPLPFDDALKTAKEKFVAFLHVYSFKLQLSENTRWHLQQSESFNRKITLHTYRCYRVWFWVTPDYGEQKGDREMNIKARITKSTRILPYSLPKCFVFHFMLVFIFTVRKIVVHTLIELIVNWVANIQLCYAQKPYFFCVLPIFFIRIWSKSLGIVEKNCRQTKNANRVVGGYWCAVVDKSIERKRKEASADCGSCAVK